MNVLLSTPVEILDVTKTIFPEATATIIENPQDPQAKFLMKLSLNGALPPVDLNLAVESVAFTTLLRQAERDLKLDRFIDRHVLPKPIDLNCCSVRDQPLRGIYRFQRKIYESEGQNIYRLLLEFLDSPEINEPTLERLGLAPRQIDFELTESGDAFKELVKKITELEKDRRSDLFSKLEKKYPLTTHQIFQEFVQKQDEGHKASYHVILKKLKDEVIGQGHATEQVATVLSAQENSSSTGVFLFVGPTGVGKTEMAKAVSRIKNYGFVFFEMMQYQNEIHCTKLFGSSAGYVGSTDRPQFAQEMQELKPEKTNVNDTTTVYTVRNAVILFDEFEKAHPMVKQSLLNLFYEKACSVQYSTVLKNITERYKFEKCLIIATSNLFQKEILTAFNQGINISDISKQFVAWNSQSSSQSTLSPELLARMTVVPFGPIPKGESYRALLQAKLSENLPLLKKSLKCKEIVIQDNAAFLGYLENKFYGEGVDIRRLKTYFEITLPNQIYSRVSTTANKKFTFICRENKLFIHVSTFLESFEKYIPDPKETAID